MNYYVVTLINKRKILVKSEETLTNKNIDLYFLGNVKKCRAFSDNILNETMTITSLEAKLLKGSKNEIFNHKKKIKK